MVDDEEAIVDFVCHVIEEIGARALPAFDGETALKIFQQDMPQIIFTDIYMPRINGIILLKRIKEVNWKIPVILFTRYLHYKRMIEDTQMRPDHFLEKPLRAEDIAGIMYKYFPQLIR